MANRKSRFGLLKPTMLMALVLVCASLVGPLPAQAQTWPSSWILIDDDPNEAGTANDYRDVREVYYNFDATYLYLRMCTYALPQFTTPSGPARFKWLIDLGMGAPLHLSGSSILGAEFILFVEDTDNDGDGEVFLLDAQGDDDFSQYEPFTYRTNPGPVTNSSLAGYRIVPGDNCVDLYLRLDQLDGITNPAGISLAWASDQENPNLEQAPASDSPSLSDVPIRIGPRLILSKDDYPDPVKVNDQLVYTIQYENAGNQTATNVTITDVLPSEVTYNTATPAPSLVSGNTLTWTMGNLPADGPHTVAVYTTVNVWVPDNAPFTNNASIACGEGVYETDSESTTANSTGILVLSKSDYPDPVLAGGNLTYTLTYENISWSNAPGTVITDVLPAEVDYVSASPAPDSISGNVLTWNIGSLPPDGPHTITIDVVVHSAVGNGTLIADQASMTSEEGDWDDVEETTVVAFQYVPSSSSSSSNSSRPMSALPETLLAVGGALAVAVLAYLTRSKPLPR